MRGRSSTSSGEYYAHLELATGESGRFGVTARIYDRLVVGAFVEIADDVKTSGRIEITFD